MAGTVAHAPHERARGITRGSAGTSLADALGMSPRLLALSSLAALGLAACTGSGNNNLVIANRSDFTLEEVHIADVNDPNWGPNMLPDVLFPGEDLVITDIACGTYDVLVVDELGTDCELDGTDLCFMDTDRWTISNTTLGVCAFGKPSAKKSE